MLKFTTADRLKQIMDLRGLRQIDIVRLCEPYCKMHKVKMGRNAISQYVSGKVEPRQNALYILGQALNVSEAWLMGVDVPMEREPQTSSPLPSPNITEDYVTFPVIGKIAAGYDKIAIEDWSGETIDIPLKFLRGRAREDFFVLTVSGDSMYPLYHEGDKVLILKQNALDRSGDIGAFIDEDGCATLKKIEYVQGEDWLKLIPLNLNYGPQLIEGEKLAHCHVIGVPRLLIREIQ